MRLFGGNRMDSIARLMERSDMEEDMPIQASMVSKAIESAQRQVENMHFAARKNVLEYDDVMNLQRSAIYGERNAVLEGKDLTERIGDIISESVKDIVEENCLKKVPSEDWDFDAVNDWVADICGREDFDARKIDHEDSPEELVSAITAYLEDVYADKTQMLGVDAMKKLQAQVMLRIIDTKWMAHLQEMDYLKAGIGLRAFGQRDPLVEYKNEAYQAFSVLTSSMYEDFLRTLLRLQIAVRELGEERSPLDKRVSYSSPEKVLSTSATEEAKRNNPRALKGAGSKQPAATGKAQTYEKDKQDPYVSVGRNDPCPCGSGKKYKKCHGENAS
jgi:preprotein translocase subunit SecA